MKRRITLILAAIVGLLACTSGTGGTGDGGTSDGSAEGSPGDGGTTENRGTTPCGPQACGPSTYCLNATCNLGCLTDDNCSSTQSCSKESGQNVGNCYEVPSIGPPTKPLKEAG